MPTVRLSCQTDASGHWCRSHDQAHLVCLKTYVKKLEAIAEAARAMLSYGRRKGPVDPMIYGGKVGTLDRLLCEIGIDTLHLPSSGE